MNIPILQGVTPHSLVAMNFPVSWDVQHIVWYLWTYLSSGLWHQQSGSYEHTCLPGCDTTQSGTYEHTCLLGLTPYSLVSLNIPVFWVVTPHSLVSMNVPVFWGVTPYSLVSIYVHFGGICCTYVQEEDPSVFTCKLRMISFLSKCEEGMGASFKVFTAVFKGSEVHESWITYLP